MKKLVATLAAAGVIGISGCSPGSGPSGTLVVDFNQTLATIDQKLQQGCAFYTGFLPTAQSIQAIILAGDPALVVIGDAVMTGENIANQLCKDLAQVPATALKPSAPTNITIDNVPVQFVPANSSKAKVL